MTLHYSTRNSYPYAKHQYILYNPSSKKPAAIAAYLNKAFNTDGEYAAG
jgi:hypothetical protein